MNNIALRIENLGKQYRIGKRVRYRALRDVITDGVAWPFRRLAGLGSRHSSGHDNATDGRETFWALKDVSFEVKRGEVLGIIGRNGAGKSTLLKILSRITEPTEGRVRVFGRVGSLLEVGTGFHPELTGRENILLNGAILGMKRADIFRQFDEIVAFAEVEQFIDTPVKHYSSGMYVRLAFAVAAHMEPDILIIDEVLAVGDAAFQKKCLGKMGDVAKEGRTVLFVSHNMGAVLRLCRSAMLLESGRVNLIGDVQLIVNRYLKETVPLSGERRFENAMRESDIELGLVSVRVTNHEGVPSAHIDLMNGIYLEISYRVLRPIRSAQVGFLLWNSEGVCVLTSTDWDNELDHISRVLEVGAYKAKCFIPNTYLRPGRYWIDIASSIPNVKMLMDERQCIAFELVDHGSLESLIAQGRSGIIAPVLDWITEKTS